MLSRFLGTVAVALVVLAGTACADTLDRITDRGRIVVGSKADFRPFGFIDPSGSMVGLELDLAQDIADRLGVALVSVPVTTANRIEFLRQGKIDLILATMSDGPKRRRAVGIVDPPYYSAGTSIIAPTSAGFERWEQLRERRVCGIQGAYYNRLIAQRYGARVIAFATVPEAQAALLIGDCAAFVQDSTLLASVLLSDPKWGAFEQPLPVIEERPWVMAVPRAERDERYGQLISEIIQDWHRTGLIIALEAKWGVPATAFPGKMHEQYR